MKAALVGKKEEAAGIKTFVFKPQSRYESEAGQFAFFNFRFNGKSYSKHFSISGSPTRENIEMTTIISESDYKKALDSLENGHEIELLNAMGEFTLKKSEGKAAIFLAGGIGITPFRSMLQYLADKKLDKKIVLFYSNRNEARIVFRKELLELQQKIPGLKVVHALTDLSDEDKKKWKGETGYIGKEMIERHASNLHDAIFYVVGPPAFVEAMNKMLSKDMGTQAKQVVPESFSGY